MDTKVFDRMDQICERAAIHMQSPGEWRCGKTVLLMPMNKRMQLSFLKKFHCIVNIFSTYKVTVLTMQFVYRDLQR